MSFADCSNSISVVRNMLVKSKQDMRPFQSKVLTLFWNLTFQKNLFYLLQLKPFENDEKCLFHLKSSFRSQDI